MKSFGRFVEKNSHQKETIFLGTPYGGWEFIDKNLYNSTIISAGIGEDISFDVEFINKYDAKVILIDPTPRSIEHINKVIENIGNKKTLEYDSTSGNQPIESYELSNVKKNNIIFVDRALFNEDNKLIKFYSPPNPEHVSHSVSDFQNKFRKNKNFIEVKTATVESLMKDHKLKEIDLIKLDIEGSENFVIPNLIKSKIFPNQILVEFDELEGNYIRSYIKAYSIFLQLFKNGYKLISTEKYPSFLFLKKP